MFYVQSDSSRDLSALARKYELQDPAAAIGKTDFDFFNDEHARPASKDEQKLPAFTEDIIEKGRGN